ncbi:MAG: hypothetical protein FRX49_05416 [Trebouxia sp. A1-2]|nr:MAG: hypothetical protein FRX49_05416 [Trebouxia sp. A1-2]
MTFSSYSELVQYLSTINPTYVKYADGLWAKEVTSPSQLGNAPMTSILACGVQSPIHAEDIITLSKFTGWESGTGVEVVERRRGSVRATWSAGDGVTGRGSKTGDAEVGDAGLEVAGIELKIGNKEGGVVGLEFHF